MNTRNNIISLILITFVAGLFSGAVIIWDINKDEAVYSKESHDDPVTSVCWLESRSRKWVYTYNR